MFAHDHTVTAPSSLTVLRKQKDFEACYGDLRGSDKDDVVNSLRTAQHDRCAYCETSVRNNSRVRIEHFHPQSTTGTGSAACSRGIGGASLDQSDLEYGNMLLCCDGHEGEPQSQTTCDVHKGSTDICDSVFNPKHQSSTRTLVRVSSDGRVHPETFPGDEESAEHIINDVLRLNDVRLTGTRKRIYGATMREATRKLGANKGRIPNASLRTQLSDAVNRRADLEAYPSTLCSVAEDIRSARRRH